jgi:UDP-N-acetylmuramoylalanine--D-glutamate ligase
MPSSPPLTWTDLRGLAVGLFGVGVEGEATLGRLAEIGVSPVALVEDAPRGEAVLATAAGGLEALASCDVVVKSPGISRYRDDVASLEAAGVAVVGGLGLWLEEVGTDRVIGITGTKGKSTTTAVAGHLANALGVRCLAGGNLGTPPWSVEAPKDFQLVVIEVSSYQATDLWSSPAVVGVTSLHEDHLDWHGSPERYFADKLEMCGRPGAVITVANGEDPMLRSREDMLRPGPRWVTGGSGDSGRSGDSGDAVDSTWVRMLGLRGRHNEVNALIAAACLEEMGVEGSDDPRLLASAARGYSPLPHRLETIAVRSGVEYVDDSLSTNVLPTIAAVEVFAGRPLALLAGGFDRAIDYEPLAAFVASRPAPTIVMALPQNGARIAELVIAAGGDAILCEELAEAVGRAASWAADFSAGPQPVVLLSPAAASYGIYRNYAARAGAFAAAVSGLGTEQ